MIDVETELFNIVAEKLREKWPESFITGEYVRVPPSFPCVSFVEVNNTPYQRSQTSCDAENHVTITYEVNVYSNKRVGKKSECKAMAAVIDEVMLTTGFDRLGLNPVPNMEDTSIYRMTGRYRGVVSKDKFVYRR